VVLKTALLLQYMVQCGLYITALPESRLGIFHQLAIDCGDGQSIEQGLSTFSAHLKGLKEILEHSGSRSLIGLDEIGAGTDPRFGAPIAQAVLEKLLANHSRVIATTHFSQLREWGTGMVDVLQASMAYDAHALKPLYRLVVGKPGSSFALELMRKTGFDRRFDVAVGTSESQAAPTNCRL
jgi:DNA mismatch repair protein MutS2